MTTQRKAMHQTKASVTKTKARVKVCEVLWFIVSLSILIGCLYFGEPVTRLKHTSCKILNDTVNQNNE